MNDDNYIGINENELIFNKDKEKSIFSGGFSVNSIMLKKGISPIMTLNNQQVGGNKVSDLFENLVIPNWTLSYNNKHQLYSDIKNDVNVNELCEDLHDKLLELVKDQNIDNNVNKSKHKITKKNKKLKNNTRNTRKK